METYHDKLNNKIDNYIFSIYRITKNFPREELFGITSQLRRSGMSVALNYIEGFARRRGDDCKNYQNFLRISYGSLKESQYLIRFSFREGYLGEERFNFLINLGDEIGAMLYSIIKD